MRKIILALLLVISMIVPPPNVQAAEVQGAEFQVPVITSFKGSVKVLKAGGMQKFTAFKGMKLGNGDIIYTGIDSSLEVSYGKKILLIGSKSMVIINEIWQKYDRDISDISLIEGSIKNKVGVKLSSDSRNQITTANMVAGVRGTEEIVAYSRNVPIVEGSSDNPYSSLLVLEGTVKISSDQPTAKNDGTIEEEIFLVTKNGTSKVIDQIAAKPEALDDVETVEVETPNIVETSAKNIDVSILEVVIEESGGDPSKISPILTNASAVWEEKTIEAHQQLVEQEEKENSTLEVFIVFESTSQEVKNSLPPPEKSIQLPSLNAASTLELVAVSEVQSQTISAIANENLGGTAPTEMAASVTETLTVQNTSSTAETVTKATQAPTTQAPTTQTPTTQAPTTQEPTTQMSTTQAPTTQVPTTQAPTTQAPTTQAPTTQAPTTQEPTTQEPTTQEPTTQEPTTQEPTTQAPTTQAPTTQAPTTQAPTTQAPTTQEPTTQEPTTQEPTTQAPTTQAPTTQAPTKQEPTTQAPTTQTPTTQEQTTQAPTTQEPTTQVPTTQEPTTQVPTTQEPITQATTTQEAETTQEPETTQPLVSQDTLYITDPGTLTYGDSSFTLSTSGGSGTGEITYSILEGNSASITSDGTVTILSIGEFKVKATKAGDSQYEATEAQISLSIGKRNMSNITIGAITNAVYLGTPIIPMPNVTDIVSGNNLLASSDFEYSYTNNLNAGTATITVTAKSDGNYLGSKSTNFTIDKVNQSTLTMDSISGVKYGDSPITLSASGGTGNADISYVIDYGNEYASISGNTLSILGAGTVSIYAVRAGDANHEDATSVAVTFTIGKATQDSLSIVNVDTLYIGASPFILSTTGGTGNGNVTYEVINGSSIQVSGNTITAISEGPATIRATKSGGSNYFDTTADINITVELNAPSLFLNSVSARVYVENDQFSLSANYAKPDYEVECTAAITYSLVSGDCIDVDQSGKVTVHGAGEATVKASIAADGYHVGSDSNQVTITILKAEQQELTINDLDNLKFNDGERELSVSGGSTSGTVVYTVVSGSATIESDNKLIVTGAGQVIVRAKMSGNANYEDVVTEKTFNVDKNEQETLTIDDLTITYGDNPKTLTTTGGSTNGVVAYSVISGPATIESGDQLTVTGAGQVKVGATMAGNANYEDVVAEKIFNVSKKEQSTLTIGDLTIKYGDAPKTLTTTGGTTNGIVTYSVISGPATIETGNMLTITGAGQVKVGATMAGNANYEDVVAEKIFNVSKKEQATLTVDDLAIKYGDAPKTLTTTGGTTNGVVTYSVISGPATIESGNKLKVTAGGLVVVKATMVGDNNYLDITSQNKTITVGKAQLTVSASNSTVIYGDVPAAFTATYTGFVNNDTEASLTGTASFTTIYNSNGSSNVGQYNITPLENLTSDKYVITYQTSTLTVTKRPITITGSVNKTLSTLDTNALLSYTATGELSGYPANVTVTSNNDAITYSGGTLTYNPAKGSGTGTKTVTIAVNSSSNYTSNSVNIPFVIADGVTMAIPVNSTNIYNMQEKSYSNMKFELTENIENLGTWKPVALLDTCEFNGKGHVIKNMNLITGKDYANAGFIGKTTGTNIIKFLGFENAKAIDVGNDASGTVSIGIIVGYMNDYGTIENCYVGGNSIVDRDLPTNTNDLSVGLIVGYSRGTTTKCYVTGEIYTKNGNRVLIGGILGKSESGYSFVNNCIAIEFYFDEVDPTDKNVAAIGCIGASTTATNNYEFGGSAARGQSKPGVQYGDGSPFFSANQYSHFGTRLPLTPNLTANWWTETLNFSTDDWDFTNPMAPKLKVK